MRGSARRVGQLQKRWHREYKKQDGSEAEGGGRLTKQKGGKHENEGLRFSTISLQRGITSASSHDKARDAVLSKVCADPFFLNSHTQKKKGDKKRCISSRKTAFLLDTKKKKEVGLKKKKNTREKTKEKKNGVDECERACQPSS